MKLFSATAGLLLAAFALTPATGPAELGAQAGDSAPWAQPVENRIAAVPFGPGEHSTYRVRLGRVTVGEGHMRVHGVEQVRGRRAYHVSMGLKGGLPFARVDNLYQSWIDVERLHSHRFIQDQDEVRTKRFRQFEFFPDELRWERSDIDESGDLPTDHPLDDISFVYYARTLDLEVGETYELDKYFQESGNPVTIKVLRKETIEVPAGRFNTIVVQPLIQTSGLFGDGGRAEIHFSDDANRQMVKLSARVPVIGSLSLELKEHEPGRRLR
ncbi:MAG: DUF3108 domain-containing protein [Gemmatimonadales bacterium]|nr:MAG: DUF3108 domain-containing protein [Gemmatimonadales bacterium]